MASARVSWRIPDELKQWGEQYAEQHHTTLSAVVVRLLSQLRKEEERREQPGDAEQV